MKTKPFLRSNRFRNGILVGLILFALYSGIGFWGLPALGKWYINQKLPEKLGRSVSVEQISMNPYVFSVRVNGLVVEDDWGDELVRVGDCYINAQLFPTVFGKLTLQSFELSDTTSQVVMNEEGVFNFAQFMKPDPVDIEAEVEADVAVVEEGSETEVVSLPKIRIRSIQLNDFAFLFEDRSLENTFQKEFQLDDLTIVELNTYPNQEMPLTLNASIAEKSRLGLTAGIVSLYPLDLKVDVQLEGFDLSYLQPYVSEYAEVEISGIFHLDFQSDIKYSDAGLDCELRSDNLIQLEELGIHDIANEIDVLKIKAFGVENVEFNTEKGTLNYSVLISDPMVELVRKADGSIQIPSYSLPTAEPEASEVEAFALDQEEAEDKEPIRLLALMESLTLSGGRIHVMDQSLATPTSVGLNALEFQLGNVAFDLADMQLSGKTEVISSFNLEQGGDFEIRAQGDLATNEYALDIGISDVALSPFQAYADEYIRAKIESGTVGTNLKIQYQLQDHRYDVQGIAQVDALRILDQGTGTIVAGLEQLKISNIVLNNDAVSVERVEINQPEGRFFIAEDGSHTVNRLLIEPKLQPDAEVTATEASDIGESEDAKVAEDDVLLAVSVGTIAITNGAFEFVDNSISPVFSLQVSKFDFDLNDVSTDVTNISTFEYTARINNAAELRGHGESSLLDATNHTLVKTDIAAFDVSSASTYGQKFIGKTIDQGHFFLDSEIVVKNQELEGENRITLKSFTLGDSVESQDSLGLPIGLAVAVLKDSEGVIKQSIPVHGDLSEPGVPVGRIALSATMTALRNVIIKAATSPFKLLAGMVGGDEDMDVLAFTAGQSSLSPENIEKLDSFAKVLESRPGLKVEIETHFDALKEREYLRDQLLYLSLESYAGGAFVVPEIINPVEQLGNLNADRVQLIERLSAAMNMGFMAEETGIADALLSSDETGTVSVEAPQEPEPQRDGDQTSGNLLKSALRTIGGIFSDERSDETGDQVSVSETTQPKATLESQSSAETVANDADPMPQIVATEADLARALEMIPAETLKDTWIHELAIARMNAVSTVLVDEKGILPERLFFNRNPISADASNIQFKLTD